MDITPQDVANEAATPTGFKDANGHDDLNASQDLTQYVSFAISDEHYCVDIMAVREIKGWSDLTVLPNQPEHVRGVLNLRGVVVPIFDIRCKFGFGVTDATAMHVVIIVSIGDRLAGLLVDRVSDILSVEKGSVQPVPDTGSVTGSDYLSGLLTSGDEMIAVLDLESLVERDAAIEALN